MTLRRFGICLIAILAAFGLAAQSTAQAQVGGIQPAGVEIGADGVLRTRIVADPTGDLTRTRLGEARRNLDADVMRPSALRKVSLTRLEAAVQERVAAGESPSAAMAHLAGLTEVQYVFFYPETREIVIAGPAEGFFSDVTGRMVGMETGKATLLLEDLVVALRAYAPGEGGTSVIACSIDPTQEGLQRMQQFVNSIGNVGPGDTAQIAAGLKENLGLQTVTLQGIPTGSHFAQVLVEADYRMKLIGIGLERPAAEIPSYVSKARPAEVSANGLARWYFTPVYDCVKVSEDRNAMQLVGSRVQLIGENERVTAEGVRVAEGRGGNFASQAFTTAFTRHYDTLAERSPVFAQLRSCMDLSIAAAYIQQQDFYTQAGWDMSFFGDEAAYSVETLDVPRQVETAVNAVWKGNRLMTPVGGGVEIEPFRAIDPARVQVDAQGELSRVHGSMNDVELTEGQWWWD